MDRDELLNNPPAGCDAVAALWVWASNESWETGDAWRLFLDLIGYSRDNFGDTVNPAGYRPDYVDLSKLADALQEYAHRPDTVNGYVMDLELGNDY